MNATTQKRKFNIIDVLIILGIVLIVVGLIFRVQILSIFDDSKIETEYIITFESDYVLNESVDRISNSSAVIWVENNVKLGTLNDIIIENAVIYSESDGKLVQYEDITHKKIVGHIVVKAVSNGGCYIDGVHFIAAAMTVTLQTDLAQFTATITSVDVK